MKAIVVDAMGGDHAPEEIVKKESLLWRAGLAMLSGGIKRLKQVTDWEQYGGAPLLGFNDLCIKAHGRSNARAITNAIRVADKALSGNLYGLISDSIDEFHRGD